MMLRLNMNCSVQQAKETPIYSNSKETNEHFGKKIQIIKEKEYTCSVQHKTVKNVKKQIELRKNGCHLHDT